MNPEVDPGIAALAQPTEQRTVDVEVEGVSAEGRKLRGYAAVFNVLSEDLGGFRELVAPGAFAACLDDDVRLLVDHDGVPLARTKAGTLRLTEDARGLAFVADLPDTTAARDLRESVSRGDVDGASFRFVIGEESWSGDVRTIVSVAQLRDVTVATYPAYPAASIELRSNTSTGGKRRQKGAEMDPVETGAETAENTENTENTTGRENTETETTETEQRSAPAPNPAEPSPAGSLHVEERTSAPMRSLSDEFRSRGFPGEAAEIPWQVYEDRAVTWTPSVNLLNQVDRQGSAFPVDRRYAWTALPRIPVDSGVTSVQVLVQTGESAATGVVRPIDSTTDKAEVGITVDLETVPLSGVAGVATEVKNIVLEQPAINSLIENSLRNAVNEGLDDIVAGSFAASDNQTVGANALIGIRKAMTTLDGDGFVPDLVLLDPQTAEDLDLLVSGVSGGTADFVYGPGSGATDVFRLRRVVSKSLDDPVVLDSRAYGSVYASPARLAAFEENAGRTNTSTVRLELNAAIGVERQDAAIRVAAS